MSTVLHTSKMQCFTNSSSNMSTLHIPSKYCICFLYDSILSFQIVIYTCYIHQPVSILRPSLWCNSQHVWLLMWRTYIRFPALLRNFSIGIGIKLIGFNTNMSISSKGKWVILIREEYKFGKNIRKREICYEFELLITTTVLYL